MSTDITDSGIVGVETEPPADLVTRATDFLLEHIDGQQSTGWMMAAFAHSHTRILMWQCHQAFQMIKEQKARAEAAEKSFSDLADQFMRVKMEKDAANKACVELQAVLDKKGWRRD